MIPRLASFYGFAPAKNGDWANVAPRKLGVYARGMYRMEAERQLHSHNVALASEGFQMAPSDRGQFLDDLKRQASGEDLKPAPQATPKSLAAMGIAFEHVPVSGPTTNNTRGGE